MKSSEIYESHFNNFTGTPRSREYLEGVKAALSFRCGESESLINPYKLGTASADAWFAGLDCGKNIFRLYKSKNQKNKTN